jgi:anti-sigma B factor antagonist
MTPLKIAPIRYPGGVFLLVVSGAIDAQTFERLQEKFRELFEQESYRIIVDMTKVEFINSGGIGVLTNATQTARAKRGNVILAGISGKVKQVFDILGITTLFTVMDSVPAALRKFQ